MNTKAPQNENHVNNLETPNVGFQKSLQLFLEDCNNNDFVIPPSILQKLILRFGSSPVRPLLRGIYIPNDERIPMTTVVRKRQYPRPIDPDRISVTDL